MTWSRAAGWGVVLLILTTIEAAAAGPRRVLLLHPFGHAFSPWSDMAASFSAELVKRSPEPIDIYETSIDTARFRTPEEQAPFVEYLRALLSGRSLDLIVSVGAPAAYFLQHHRSELFPSTPMLIAGADQRRVPDATLGANDTLVALAIDLPAYIENVLRLRPDTKNIAVVIGHSPVEQFWRSEMLNASRPFAARVNFTWFNDLSFDEMLTRAADLPPQSAIIYYLVSEDAKGVPYSQDRALDAIRAVAAAPIFGVGDYQLGRGIVGGPLLPSQALGQKAAGVALRILGGERPSDIKTPPVGFGAPAYDWRELRRWRISEARLPPGSIVQFREPTIWEQYRWEIASVAMALLVQTLLIVGLIYEHRRRHHAELESRRRMGELTRMNRFAIAGEMSASIAHEINQPLAAIVLSGNAGLRWLSRATPNLDEVSESLKQIVSDGHRAGQVIAAIRAMVKKDVQQKTLVDINQLIREVPALLHLELEGSEVVVTTTLTEGIPPVSADRVQLQQVILNLVRNAVEAMHSVTGRARRLRIRSEASESDEMIVSIEDSGIGIDPKNLNQVFEPFFTTKSKGMGIGLSICRSIVEDHGGKLTVKPGKIYGTVFELVLPIPHSELSNEERTA